MNLISYLPVKIKMRTTSRKFFQREIWRSFRFIAPTYINWAINKNISHRNMLFDLVHSISIVNIFLPAECYKCLEQINIPEPYFYFFFQD